MSTQQRIELVPVKRSRAVELIVPGQPTSDGAGVRLARVLTQDLQERLDPFLIFDHFVSDDPDDYVGGFPDHPHRGFETVTYMVEGRLRHRDSAGNEGLLENGGVQWMTAGRGVIHSEMPEQENGLMEGFQLWLNLPARDKMCKAGYRDIAAEELPTLVTPAGATVHVIAGESHGVAGAVTRKATRPLFLDIHLPKGVAFEQTLAPTLNAFAYVYRGAVTVGDQAVSSRRMAVLDTDSDADGVTFEADSRKGARLLLIAGEPLREPIAQYGPFVMNSESEILTAVSDYRAGRLV